MKTINVVQIGLGPIGKKITQIISKKKGIEVIGAVDISSDLKGKDLGEVCGLESMGINIHDTIKNCLNFQKPDAVILTTVSSFQQILPQIEEILSFSVPIVTTCEELSYSWERFPDLSKKVDAIAKKQNVAVVSTGVNPGFLMDALPTFLTSVCQDLQYIRVERIQNAAFRRLPFQKKIGAGLSVEEFEVRKREGSLKHVGLQESIYAIAKKVGWIMTSVGESIEPVLAQETIETENLRIPLGHVAGVLQVAHGNIDKEIKIELIFRATIGDSSPRDLIEIKGTPSFKSLIDGGINGDVATCAITINTVEQILNSRPGLRSMTDIPLVSFIQ